MAKPRRGDTLEFAIEDLAFGGEGVGRADGYVVFVRGGLPGDRLRVRVVEARGRFGRAVIDEVLVASPDRVDPPCPYFGRCGGCRLQHLAYSAQLAFKEKQRSEEHTSELQSLAYLVCRLLLEKKKKNNRRIVLIYDMKQST